MRLKSLAAAFVLAVTAAFILPFTLGAQSDITLAENHIPRCNALGISPNLYYNASRGIWSCSTTPKSFLGAVNGTVSALADVIVDVNKSIDTIGIRSGYVLGGTGVAGSALSDAYFDKEVTGIPDGTATAIVTVTVPNAAHAAVIPIVIMSRIGAGGAVGADECVGTAYGQIVVERVSGAATVASATTLSNAGSSCSSGATTITTSYAVSSITGANSATQTFTVNVTVAHGGGSSTNHKVDVQLDVLNANVSGITVS